MSPRGTFPRVSLGGTPVDLCEKDEFLSLVRRRLQDDAPPLFVGSANLDHIHHFSDSWGVMGGWIMLLDGEPMAWMTRWLTRRAWPRLAGSDLTDELLRIAEESQSRVGFLGGRAEVHLSARTVVSERFPALPEPVFWSPSRVELDEDETCHKIAAEIKNQAIDMLFVCLGKPRQENWIHEYGSEAAASVQLGFGASVDFLAGAVPRAPEWMRSAGLEWMFRLAREPRRLGRRYLLQGPPALVRLLFGSRI